LLLFKSFGSITFSAIIFSKVYSENAMSVEVVMPQMGESIAEGTITKWLKQPGERVERDEPLFEISTDKVDAEIPSPSAGVLMQILHKEGETVEVNKVVALLDDGSGASVSAPVPAVAQPAPVVPVVEESAPVVVETPAVPVVSVSASPSGATVDVVMPQMGESIAEGTITKWLKKVGDKVERDEPLFEISTDKVDAEIPAPSAGVLIEIKHQEGETVEVGKVVALLGSGNGTSAPVASTSVAVPVVEAKVETPAPITMPVVAPVVAAPVINKPIGEMTVEELRKVRSSPLVRNIAKEHGIDLSRISGTGASGRVTKNDIMRFIESGAVLTPQQAMVTAKTGAALPTPTPTTVAKVSPMPVVAKTEAPQPAPTIAPAVGDRVETMSVMRKKIAEHMTFSKRTSAHVTTVYEIDMTNVVKLREKNKKSFQERYGTKLTFMPFIFQAVCQAIRKFPIVNSQVSGDQIIYKGDINLGMAVALDWGLIVPVIKRADQLSIPGLALAANDLADRARAKQLKPDEVAGGTFTITNPGVFGGLFGTPIINQPQVAILGVGTIEKRPKVITTAEGDDVIAIRSMAYFALTFDHRIVDGADAERYLSYLKEILEAEQFQI
jgi:2-oxoglutarate dehydrogenase E2 component (dihydrolipoamide succinyltransferase)